MNEFEKWHRQLKFRDYISENFITIKYKGKTPKELLSLYKGTVPEWKNLYKTIKGKGEK